MNQEREVGTSFEVGGEGDVMEQTPDGIAKVNG
jgi:hypothetical protein